MAITLVQFWTAERDAHKLAQAGAQGDLTAAQAALVAAKAALDTDTTALGKTGADISADRKALASTSGPSAVTALNAKIRDEIIKQRTLQGMVLDDQDSIATAQANLDGAAAALARASAKVADAEAQLTTATAAAAKRKTLADQLALPPFSSMKADATAFAAGAVATDAKTEIDATFPADLQAIATDRRKTRAERAADLRKSLEAAEDALGTARATADGHLGDAAKKEIDFRRADDALRVFVTTAKLRYDRAITVMSDLQAMKNGTKTPDLLSAQEKADIAASAARTTAETNAVPIDTDRAAVYTAQNALDTAILAQISTDVDTLRTDAALQLKRAAPGTATATLVATQVAYAGSADKKTLDEWEAVVQDAVWSTLIDYLDAKDALDYLQGTTPADFGTTLATAEDACAVALGVATKAQREEDAFSDEIALRSARVDAATASLPGRLLSAVRGDSF
jgi:hypothetical protein